MGLSSRYPPVQGRLHTRYAPVRRSPAQYCYRLLPLDLHVLSLPLAFILSQDQTLHCKNCFFTFDSSRVRLAGISGSPTHAISSLSSVSIIARFRQPLSPCPLSVESECKDTTIFHSGKIFFQKNSSDTHNTDDNQLFTKRKKFSHARNGPAKTPARATETPFFGLRNTSLSKNRRLSLHSIVYQCIDI